MLNASNHQNQSTKPQPKRCKLSTLIGFGKRYRLAGKNNRRTGKLSQNDRSVTTIF